VAKVAITCNCDKPESVFPTFILASSAAALGDEVILFFTHNSAHSLTPGELEKMVGLPGLPDIVKLYEGCLSLDAKIYICELVVDTNGLAIEDFREGVELVGSAFFMNEIKDATVTFSF
jgi:predicted peroxiredoxin